MASSCTAARDVIAWNRYLSVRETRVKIKLAIIGAAWVLCLTACSGDTQQSPASGGATGSAGTAGSANAGKGGQSSGGSSHAGASTVGPNTPLDDFPHVYADSVCQLLIRCYAAAATAISPDCTSFFDRLFREQSFPHIVTAVAEGRVQYHPEAVPQCLDEVGTGSCDIAVLQFCPRVFVGTKNTGEACTVDVECVDQQCAVNGACPGACAPAAALGATCTNENQCQPELACRADDAGNMKCVNTAKLGEPCSETVRCRGYTTCSGLDTDIADDTGVCANRADLDTTKLDGPCNLVNGPFCEPGLVCTTRVEAGITVGSCRPKVPSGSACTFSSPDACPDGEYCHITSEVGVKPATGSCTPEPGVGEECRYGAFYSAPCGADQFCNFDTKLCAESKHIDEACSIDDECYSNHCSAAGKCVTLLECEESAEP